jgi:hypothetical protein
MIKGLISEKKTINKLTFMLRQNDYCIFLQTITFQTFIKNLNVFNAQDAKMIKITYKIYS